jgi:hypothetical protein
MLLRRQAGYALQRCTTGCVLAGPGTWRLFGPNRPVNLLGPQRVSLASCDSPVNALLVYVLALGVLHEQAAQTRSHGVEAR